VVVTEDQLSLAIGKHGQNVRLAARLSGWDIDILTPEEYNNSVELLANTVKKIEGADDVTVDKLIALGVVSVLDLEDVGTKPLVEELKLAAPLAERLVAAASEEVKRLDETARQKQAERELAHQAKVSQPPTEL
jgi:N utilization substance protein A